MMNNTKTECDTKLCHYDSNGTRTRTNFYNGMLLTAEHLRDEQTYHREALKRFSRHIFGWGIVCGLTVEKQQVGLCIQVHPGVALDCCGNLIEVCKCITIDLSKECKKQYGSGCIQPNNQQPDQFQFERYLVLRYDEQPSDPQPVLSAADDCAQDKPKCQPSKIREGYCLELWEKCPCTPDEPVAEKPLIDVIRDMSEAQKQDQQKQAKMAAPGTGIAGAGGAAGGGTTGGTGQQPDPTKPGPGQPRDFFDDFSLPCMPCGCCEPAVGLAKLTINCATSTVEVDYEECRPYVITPRLVRWLWLQRPTRLGPDEMNRYLRRGDPATANMIMAAVAVDQRAEQIQTLQNEVAELKEQSGGKKTGGKKGLPSSS